MAFNCPGCGERKSTVGAEHLVCNDCENVHLVSVKKLEDVEVDLAETRERLQAAKQVIRTMGDALDSVGAEPGASLLERLRGFFRKKEKELEEALDVNEALGTLRALNAVLDEAGVDKVPSVLDRVHALVRQRNEATASKPPASPGRKLPKERQSKTHHVNIGGHDVYIIVGLHEDGMPGEVFIQTAKQGSTASGFAALASTALSISLRHGVSLEKLCKKVINMRFEPNGPTSNPQIPVAESVPDYVFRYLMQYLDDDAKKRVHEHLAKESAPAPRALLDAAE